MLFFLAGWTTSVCIGAKDAAILNLGMKDGAATGALIKNHSDIRRDLFDFFEPTVRTGNEGFQISYSLFSFYDLNLVR